MFDPEFEWHLLTDEPGAKAQTGGSLHSGNRNQQRKTVQGALPGASRGTPAEETFPGSGYADPPQEWVSAQSIPCECTCPRMR